MDSMERKILHVDINNCYASIECARDHSLRGKPVAVAGDPEQRHGIILAKNQAAKGYGIKTGEALWQAFEKCRNLVVLKPNFPLYLEYSRKARAIYESYADRVEPFGIDECWMDVSGYRGSAADLANEIRERIKRELDITVSVGVSFNKIFAKLGSDMKKPDAVTVIGKDDFREKIWCLPAADLLFVGRATKQKLEKYGIHTIGQLAQTRPEFLEQWLGKNGIMLWQFANGLDTTPVKYAGECREIKSIGNSTTAYRDLVNNTHVKLLIFTLAESVAMRLRRAGLKAEGVSIYVRDKYLISFTRQCRLSVSTSDASYIAKAAYELFLSSYSFERGQPPIRSLGVSVFDLLPENAVCQFDMFQSIEKQQRLDCLNKSVDELRARYGYTCIRRATVMADKTFSVFDTAMQNEIHPVGYSAG